MKKYSFYHHHMTKKERIDFLSYCNIVVYLVKYMCQQSLSKPLLI